jgi:Pentapeptide repeats (8 copies)
MVAEPVEGGDTQDYTPEQLAAIWAKHTTWLNGGSDGACAQLSDANLTGAYLTGANLRGACLTGANLRGACLTGAGNINTVCLVSDDPILSIGPIGSRAAYMMIYNTDNGVYVGTGCFFRTVDEFIRRVASTHGDNKYGRDYRAAVVFAQAVMGQRGGR